MRLAIEDGKRQGLNVEETMQLIADTLINDPDPDVAAFQERHNRYVRRLQEIERAQKAERAENEPLN
jgi:hypothetical protein